MTGKCDEVLRFTPDDGVVLKYPGSCAVAIIMCEANGWLRNTGSAHLPAYRLTDAGKDEKQRVSL